MILVLCIDDCKIKGRSSILALKFKKYDVSYIPEYQSMKMTGRQGDKDESGLGGYSQAGLSLEITATPSPCTRCCG